MSRHSLNHDQFHETPVSTTNLGTGQSKTDRRNYVARIEAGKREFIDNAVRSGESFTMESPQGARVINRVQHHLPKREGTYETQSFVVGRDSYGNKSEKRMRRYWRVKNGTVEELEDPDEWPV